MHVRLLGPMMFDLEGRPAIPAAPKQRQILALLALCGGRLVTTGELFAELWGEDPPPSARVTLQSYIVRLRRQLEGRVSPAPEGTRKETLRTVHGGYLLQLPPGALDVHLFEQASVQGRAALGAGDDERAARLLQSALDLWRGPALADIPAGRVLEPEVTRLTEMRLATATQLLGAQLRLGRHLDVLGQLQRLAGRHPFHENLHALLMVALYQSSRRPEALHVYARLRTALADEFGLDPSPQLQRLHHALLRGEPALAQLNTSTGLPLDAFAA